jgi:hypothetical protein
MNTLKPRYYFYAIIYLKETRPIREMADSGSGTQKIQGSPEIYHSHPTPEDTKHHKDFNPF